MFHVDSVPTGFGLIARVETQGSKTIDTTKAYWAISAVESGMYVGLPVNKLGDTTGFQPGIITNTCDDYFQSGNRTLTCATDDSTIVGHGDSGGPVYWPNGSSPTSITLAGITSAESGHLKAIFSSFSRIATDLGISVSNVRNPGQQSLSIPSITASVTGSYHGRIDWSAISGASKYYVTVGDYYTDCFDDWGCFEFMYASNHYTVTTNYYEDPRTFSTVLNPGDPRGSWSEYTVQALDPYYDWSANSSTKMIGW